MPTTFWYRHPDVSPKAGRQSADRALRLRHNPTAINWNYNVMTQSYDTYGGQVIQVLGVNIDNLVIQGQLGKEGAFGIKKTARRIRDPRWGGTVPAGGYVTRDHNEQFEYNGIQYPGLHAMVEFFREYFAFVSQGGDLQNPGRFQQIPMHLSYGNTYTDIENGREVTGRSDIGREWKIIPRNFPSFRRSNEDFAPEWRVECEVIEADRNIIYKEKQAAIARLQAAIGYRTINPFSDPLANPAYNWDDITDQIVSQYKAILPKITRGDLENMVWQNITVPNITEGRPIDKALTNTDEYLEGEIGRAVEKKFENITKVEINRSNIRRSNPSDKNE